MEAPAQAYLTDDDGNLYAVERAKADGTVMRAHVARFLKGTEEDGGYSTTDAGLQGGVKRLFFLNELILCSKDGKVGFLGLVPADGSGLAQRHNLAKRDSGMRFTDERTGTVYAILNDAGLNVRPGYGSGVSVSGGVVDTPSDDTVIINFMKVKYSADNAFYGVARYVFTVTVGGSVAPVTLASGSLLPNEKNRTETFDVTDLPSSAVAGKTVRFSLTVSNGEGSDTYTTRSVELLPAVAAQTVYETDNRTEEWNTGTKKTVYIGERDLAWLIAQIDLTSPQNVDVDPDDLPDGGKVYEAPTSGTFREVLTADYNLRNYIGFRYDRSLGRIRWIYAPNPSTSQGYWKVLIFASVETYHGTGWPESPGGQYPYRIAIFARFEPVADPEGNPPATTITDMDVYSVDEQGFQAQTLQFYKTSFTDTSLTLAASGSARATSKTYFYARAVPNVTAFGVKASASVNQTSVVPEFPITEL